MYTDSDPVEDGLVTSLGRPEDNVTGIALSINPQTVMAITVAAPPYSHIANARSDWPTKPSFATDHRIDIFGPFVKSCKWRAEFLHFVITVTANEAAENYWCVA